MFEEHNHYFLILIKRKLLNHVTPYNIFTHRTRRINKSN